MRILLGSVAAMFIAAAANAQTMNAETFHQRATKLKSKGAVAIFSLGEIKALTNEAKAAGKQVRERRLAAVKAGQKPRYCPIEERQKLDSDEFMNRLSAIPTAERAHIDMTEAMTRIFAVKFPCAKA